MTRRGTELLIRGAVLSTTGQVADVLVTEGRIERILTDRERGSPPRAQRRTVEAHGHVLFPSFVEPHAHLDKVFIIDESVRPGDLHAAIDLFKRTYYSTMDSDDIYARASAAVRIAVSRGVTSIRTHIDVGASAGVLALDPILALREELRGVLDLQVVALVLPPALEERQKEALARAIEGGVDALGGCPTLEADPRGMIDWVLAAAREAGLPVDFHLDEAQGARSVGIEALLDSLDSGGAVPALTASHCVSLGDAGEQELAALLTRLRAHDVGVVTLPQTNLLLQARGMGRSKPRGMPPLRALLEHGIDVAAGGDNWRDPFNPLSRIDPLEIVSLLVSAGHLDPHEALERVTSAGRAVLGSPEVGLEEGRPADLVAVKGETPWAALADASEQRIVIKGGAVVSRTRVVQNLDPRLGG